MMRFNGFWLVSPFSIGLPISWSDHWRVLQTRHLRRASPVLFVWNGARNKARGQTLHVQSGTDWGKAVLSRASSCFKACCHGTLHPAAPTWLAGDFMDVFVFQIAHRPA
jgi:hypothetical protein